MELKEPTRPSTSEPCSSTPGGHGRGRAMPKVTLETFDLIRDSDMLLKWLAQAHVAKSWGDAARAMHGAA
jgi:hypothetical protein